MSAKKYSNKILAAIFVIIIFVAAVGAFYYGLKKSKTSTLTHTSTMSKIEGRISQKGSDTLLIVAQRWAEEFSSKPEYKEVRIAVSGGGSGTGIAALIDGQIDLADSSREIKQSEITQAKEKGITPEEWKVGLDGIIIIVHRDNPLSELALNQLEAIYTGDVSDWSELGGVRGRIITYGRQANSGTYVFFQEYVLNKRDYRTDMQSLNGNADIVEAVLRDKNGIGYVGLAYAEERGDEIKIIKVKKDDSSPAVAPSIETVSDGSYSIARFLYIYTNGIPTGPTGEFLRFIISDEGQMIVEEVGFIPLPNEIQEKQLSELE